ncbi:hypothetical protein Pcinc_013895 [Petrolisthes cinctipes]|uniref:Uncharacterized protein n=1 Tax=Petrolisthes cinctipes TaxID=88211 RepID=A0AAE1FXY9_PETCI|nr:hypothetical protein Pcinc_013895 [Petrolisthes cinctipes]
MPVPTPLPAPPPPPSLLLTLLTLTALQGMTVLGCNKETRDVGVCLHVYLERDFLTLESIVYPRHTAERREKLYNMYINSFGDAGALRQLPPLPDLPLDDPITAQSLTHTTPQPYNHSIQRASNHTTPQPVRVRRATIIKTHTERGNRIKRGLSAPDKYAVIGPYGRHGWVEGPELEDYCSRLGSVIECFEEVLIDCDNGHDFFRYRHLLHSLALVHQYLCYTADDRATKFLPFLKVIDCAENARLSRTTCHRPNVTVNVWNQILRLELGPELCDSLNTQRSCLLENNFVHQECGGPEKEELYLNPKIQDLMLKLHKAFSHHTNNMHADAPAAQTYRHQPVPPRCSSL